MHCTFSDVWVCVHGVGDELDIIVTKGMKGIPIDGLDEPDEPGFGEQIGRTLGSLRSFMNALTK